MDQEKEARKKAIKAFADAISELKKPKIRCQNQEPEPSASARAKSTPRT